MRTFRYTLFLGLLGFAAIGQAATSVAPPLDLIPMPAQVVKGQGTFEVNAQTPVVIDAGDAQTKQTADYLVAQIAHSQDRKSVV